MKRALCLALLALLGLSCAWADYKADLIAEYPFYDTAVGKFAPVYPALAQQIVQDYGITKGVCVDMGGGCGSWAIALAKITELKVYVLDIDPAAVRLCGLLVDEAGLRGRVIPIEGDAQDMPFRDNFADLVISRGSIFFWPDQLAGLREAYRVLKPGGIGFVGGCFGRLLDPKVRDELTRSRKQSTSKSKSGWRPVDSVLLHKARAAGIRRVRLISDTEDESWIEIRKPGAAASD